MASTVLGCLEDIEENGCRGFVVGDLGVFAVRRGGEVYVYRNCCPHARLPLNWLPDRFLDLSKTYLQCSAHGALFEITSGRCVAGPCVGQFLTALTAQVIDGKIQLDR